MSNAEVVETTANVDGNTQATPTVPDGMDADDVEKEVNFLLAGLNTAEELEEICGPLDLEVTAAIHGKTKPLYKFLLRHLNSETAEASDDGGLSSFLKVYDCLSGTGVDKKGKKSSEVNVLNAGLEQKPKLFNPSFNGTTVKRTPLFDLQKLKDFKIHGVIGGEKKDNSLTFSSLKYQMMNGITQGYTEEAICAAVLKAIAPGNLLRTYLENASSLTVNSLLDILRSHYHEKDSSSAFTDLCNAVQESDESAQGFVVRVLVLRQNVLNLAVEEGIPYDTNLVQKRLLHTIETGLRNNNIRSELRDLTIFAKTKPLSDETLLKAVSEAMANESERSGKLKYRDTGYSINRLNKGEKSDVLSVEENAQFEKLGNSESKKKKENGLQSQFRELKMKQEQELAALKSDLCEIKTALQENLRTQNNSTQNNGGGPGQNNQNNGGKYSGDGSRIRNYRNRRGGNKCQQCVASGSFARCTHCFLCYSEGHRMAECTKNGP